MFIYGTDAPGRMKGLQNPQYFEGVLQLRNFTPEVLAWVRKRTVLDKRAVISKEARVPGGVDVYFTDQHYMQALGKKLRERWQGEYKVSYRLHTMSHLTSKELYRITILFRMLDFKVGDVVD